MGKKDNDRLEKPLEDLCTVLDQLARAAKDRLECYRELVEHEWIPEEMFIRLIHNERLGLITEIDDLLDYYRGIH